MTVDEFNNTRWGARMFAVYEGKKYKILSVNFSEGLVGICNENDNEQEEILVRCENLTLEV